MVLLHTSQGEMGEVGAEGTEGDKGEIGLKGTEGPPGPAGLVGVKVSVPAVRSKCSTLPEKKKTLYCMSAYISVHFLPQGPEGKPGLIGERGKPGEKVCQFLR